MSNTKISNITDISDRVNLNYIVAEIGISIIFKKQFKIIGNTYDILFGVPEYKDTLLIGTTNMHKKGNMLPFTPVDDNWYRLLGDYAGVSEIDMHLKKEEGYLKAYVGENLKIDYDPNETESINLLTDLELVVLYKELSKVRENYKMFIGKEIRI
jgi:hypothetical protein